MEPKKIDLKLETVEVKVEHNVIPLPTVRECNRNVWDRIETFFYWLFNRNGKTYKGYLDTQMKYTVELGEMYYHADIINGSMMSDEEMKEILETCWKETKEASEWVIFPDVELDVKKRKHK